MNLNTFFSLILLICSCLSQSLAHSITVDAHTEKCFFNQVEAGTKMSLTFDIIEGGFLDIDVRIIDPKGNPIYKGERETSGNYTFAAHTPGTYTYCFSNKIHTITYRVVMFNMAIGESPKGEEQQEGKYAITLEKKAPLSPIINNLNKL